MADDRGGHLESIAIFGRWRGPVAALATTLTLAAVRVPAATAQVPSSPDTTYANARVRAAVALAAAEHARPPDGLTAFASTFESEIAILIHTADGSEVATQVEQVSGRVSWRRGGLMTQRVSAYRALFLSPTVSVLSFLDVPWVFAPLYGDRIPLIFAPDTLRSGRPGSPDAEKRRRAPNRLVNPFASDRADFYRFSGGDTVLQLSLPERTVPLVRVVVEALGAPDDAMVFEGEIDLDATRHRIVRMRGRLLGRPQPPSLARRVLDVALGAEFFIVLESAEWEGEHWLPYRQQVEVVASPTFATDQAVLRIVTAFGEPEVNAAAPADTADPNAGARRTLVWALEDSSSVTGGWERELGAVTAEHNVGDFADLSGGVPGARSAPRLRFGTGGISDAVRYDRVEGLFTGATVSLDRADRGPGGFARVHGGFAWAESTARGGAEVGLRGRRWEAALVAERRLASTNDFPHALLRGPTVLGVFGGDDFDYVGRSAAGARLAWSPGRRIGFELGAGVAQDRALAVHVPDAPLGGAYRPLRPVREGSYGYVRATADIHGAAGGPFLVPGVSAQATLDVASGSLEWRRVEASVRGRRQLRRWSFAGEMNGGAVFSDDTPPQALFEVGGSIGRLPGFDYKAFTGDRAALVSGQAMFALPWAERPIRLGSLILPALAPSPAVEVEVGWVGASERTATLLRSLGWSDSDGVRATAFLGIRAVAGMLRMGFARPVGEHGPWRFELGLYQTM